MGVWQSNFLSNNVEREITLPEGRKNFVVKRVLIHTLVHTLLFFIVCVCVYVMNAFSTCIDASKKGSFDLGNVLASVCTSKWTNKAGISW